MYKWKLDKARTAKPCMMHATFRVCTTWKTEYCYPWYCYMHTSGMVRNIKAKAESGTVEKSSPPTHACLRCAALHSMQKQGGGAAERVQVAANWTSSRPSFSAKACNEKKSGPRRAFCICMQHCMHAYEGVPSPCTAATHGKGTHQLGPRDLVSLTGAAACAADTPWHAPRPTRPFFFWTPDPFSWVFIFLLWLL